MLHTTIVLRRQIRPNVLLYIHICMNTNDTLRKIIEFAEIGKDYPCHTCPYGSGVFAADLFKKIIEIAKKAIDEENLME